MYFEENRCIECLIYFCCPECRRKHEIRAHDIFFDCDICRGRQYLCRPELLTAALKKHLEEKHLPLKCSKCLTVYGNLDELTANKCSHISQLNYKDLRDKEKNNELHQNFEALYDTLSTDDETEKNEGMTDVYSEKTNKIAIITTHIEKKYIVDYEESDPESDSSPLKLETPLGIFCSKTPKIKRTATPHVKKLNNLLRQKAIDLYDQRVDEENNGFTCEKTTPNRNEAEINKQVEITTPTSHLVNTNVMKLAQTVTTSTPTHPANEAWSIFPETGVESPLSEIENSESPAQSVDIEPSKLDCEQIPPKLKSIIITGGRSCLGSQDSSEKQFTLTESSNNSEPSSTKIKRVTFARDTVFESENKVVRNFRKPKRLTPGPQKSHDINPRIQALVNRFELIRTPVHENNANRESTPSVEVHGNMPARTINFIEDSPVVDSDISKESNELYMTCEDLSQTDGFVVDTASNTLTSQVAGYLQKCLQNAVQNNNEETEIKLKLVIAKQKLDTYEAPENEDIVKENTALKKEIAENEENIWTSITRAVKSMLWGEGGVPLASDTPLTSSASIGSSASSSASKRKNDDISDSDESSLNPKRHKYVPHPRPPIRSRRRQKSPSKSDKKETSNQNF